MGNEANSQTVVSFIIVARDAAGHLARLLDGYLAQDYAPARRELLIVDGRSTDDTRAIAERFRAEHRGLAVQVLDNPKKNLAAGWNVALANAAGTIMLRVDAHARIPPDFIRCNVERIHEGQDICGGEVACDPPDRVWPHVLYLAECSKFGSGLASFRNPGKPRCVDTLAYAAYRREVFVRVGGYDERILRNQDNEIHRRMKRAGFRFFYDPAIRSWHAARNTLRGLLKQKFENGRSVGLVLGIRPMCFRIRHVVPGLFVLALAVGLILARRVPLALAAAGFPYLLLDAVFTGQAVVRAQGRRRPAALLLVFVFPMMHIAYGLGTLLGLLEMPFFVLATRGYRVPRPIREAGGGDRPVRPPERPPT